MKMKLILLASMPIVASMLQVVAEVSATGRSIFFVYEGETPSELLK